MNNNVHKRATTTTTTTISASLDVESKPPKRDRDPKLKKLRRIQRSNKRKSKRSTAHAHAQAQQTMYLQLLLGFILLVTLTTTIVYRLLSKQEQVLTSPHVLQALENEHAHTHGDHHVKDNDVDAATGGTGGTTGTTGLSSIFGNWFTSANTKSARRYAGSSSSTQGGSYKHAYYMDHIGDKTRYYASLRQDIDSKLPSTTPADTLRMNQFAQSIRPNTYSTILPHDLPYDIYACPDDPPPNYPHAWNVKDVLDNWPPDDVTPRTHIYQGLCRFDATIDGDFQKALNYRRAEVPFVYRNDPNVLQSVERWNQENYLNKLIENDVKHRTEYSHDNHFMYWQKPRMYGNQGKKKMLKNWKAPTEMIRMTYGHWLEKANSTYAEQVTPNQDHWYFRLIGCGEMGNACDKGSSEYLFDELSFFQPRDDNPLYMPYPKKQKGIHCRFGMKGVIAENHFDGSRNMIVILGGERRYILSHPDQCTNLELLPRGHPSARHSEVDWSQPDWVKFPKFKEAEVNEVVLQAGDVLYLPTHWFHYIISLGLNFQCNSRSGASDEYKPFIEECGF